MSSYFSNTEYHLESRREVVSGLHNNLQQGSRSALGTSVSFSLYNSEGFTQELNYSGSSWDAALNMSNNISNGIFAVDTSSGKSSAFDNRLVLGLSQTVSSRTFSEFDSNIANSLKDSRNSLKFLMGEAYRIDPSETKAYASQLVFENLFGSILSQRGMYVGSNNASKVDNYYLNQSIDYARAFDKLRMTDKQSIESRGQETLDRLVYSDLFGTGLVPIASGTDPTEQDRSFYDNVFNNINRRTGSTISDLAFIRSKSMTNELVGGNVSRTTRSVRGVDVAINNSYQQKAEGIIHDIKYQTRPGILPFVAMFEAANSSITIDTFQYQNKAISDVVVSKIYREIITNKNYGFKVNMTVGTPLPSDDGTGAAIFGPNILEVVKMQKLQEVITKQLKAEGIEQNIIDQVNSNFTIQLAGPAHHRKVYITDQAAVLGSINLTSPVGDSVFKAGSNFEMLGMFHSDKTLVNVRNNKAVPYSPEYIEQTKIEQQDVYSTVSKKTRSALLYEQVVAAQKEQAVTRSSQSNIKYATDVMYALKATVDYLHKETGRESKAKDNNLENLQGKLTSDLSMTMVLDQAYLLHVNHLDMNGQGRGYRDDTNAINKNNQEMGEMGRFNESDYNSPSFKSRQDIRYDMYKSIQRKNFTLVAMGITNIVVDPKNYRSQVIEPTWDFINLRLKNAFVSDYGGSIRGFVEGVTRGDSSFGAKVAAINTALNINDTSSNTAYQILAIASGNMSGANVPRQHAKAFEAKRNLGGGRYQGISSYMGSANLSMSNMGVGINSRYLEVGGNDPFVTDEMGVVLINRNVFEKERDFTLDDDYTRNIQQLSIGFNNEFALNYEEELAEMKDASKAVVMAYNQLNYGNRIESGILQSIEGLPYWAKQANTGDLLKLEASLKNMSKGLGEAMSVNRKYDRFGTPNMLEISINPSGLVGLNTASSRLTYTVTMLQGDGNQPGPVFFQKEGKLIYNSNFTNTSGKDIVWNYSNNKGGRLADGQSAEMSSIDNTTSIFATMIAEMAYKQTISNPRAKLVGIDEAGSTSLMLDYTASVLGINRYLLEDSTTGRYADGNTFSDYLFASGKHINLSFELSSRLATKGVGYLDSTRSFARIDVNSSDRSGLREHIQGLRDATSGSEVYSRIDAISKLMGQQGFEDLALDVLRVNSRYNAEGDINAQMRELSSTIFDPYLQAHQAVTYGAGVAASKLISYGIDATDAQALFMLDMGESVKGGLLDTLNYARTFARDVSVYSTFGFDGADERFYIGGVAEGVSTQNKKGYQLNAFGVRNKFPIDRNSLDILEGTGIGNLVSKERLLKRFTSDEADQILSNLNIKGKGILFNLDPNKPAQINQRIKNALGSRLMYEINSEAAAILKGGGTLKAFKSTKIDEANKTLGMLVGLLGDDDKAKKFISNYLTAEEVGMASMYDTDVRTALNESAYNFVIEQRKELYDVFKDVDINDEQRSEVDSALNYMFRMKMISHSFSPNSIGSVVGGRRDKPQFMILQLNGGYSDHFYLNPKFRTTHYAAPSTATTTGIKASMLDSRTFVGQIDIDGNMMAKDGFVVKEGDMFIYDKNVNKVVQVKAGMSLNDGTAGNTYVGGSGSSDYLLGQIENFSLLGKPVASVKQRSTSNRPGEDSVQYILTAKKREGGSSVTNELVFEVSVMNILQTGSGRRQEGTAASTLFKGVGAFIDGGQFSKLFDSFKEGISHTGKNSGVGVSSFNKMNVSLSDVYGLINPNNLKSGFFVGHGSALLTTKVGNESMAKMLIKQDNDVLANKMLAAALVSQFGYDITNTDGLRDAKGKHIINPEAISNYKKSALKGEFGTYLRVLETQRTIAGDKGIASADNIFGSIPQFILQDRALSKAINSALLDGGGNLSELLGSYVDKVQSFDDAKGYLINSSDMYTRGLTAILTAVDMFGQLKNQKGDMQFVTDWLLKTKSRQADGSYVGTKTNDPLVEIMAAIGGSSDAFNMTSSDKDELADMMQMYLTNNYAVALALNVLPSQSKDPLGKNMRAKTEMQHLLKPLYAQSKQFTRTGGKNNLAFVLGTIFAAQETSLISLGMSDSKDYLNSIQHVNALDPTTVSGFFGHRFLGLYYNANSNSKDLILQYKKIYSNTVRKDFDVNKVDMYLEDGSLTLAEATYVDKNVSVVSKNSSVSYTERLRNLGEHITAELKQEAIKYNLEESKGMGTDITAPKLQVLQEMGSRTFNVLMPEIVGNIYQNQITGDSNIVFSNNHSKYIFMPGAELLNQVGSSFGDFVSDIVGKSINLYSYFTPGTTENDLLKKIASAKLQQGRAGKYTNFNLNLSVEETQMLSRLYNLGDELLQSIVEASSDTLMQKAVSGHGTEFDGYVSTPIPNMALNYNMNVMPDYVNDRYGAPEAIANVRKQWLSVTTDAHLNYNTYADAINDRFKNYRQAKQVKDFTKSMGVVLDYQRHMLVKGLSQPAIAQLVNKGGALEVIDQSHSLITELQQSKDRSNFDTSYIDKQLDKYQTSLKKIRGELKNTGAYDEAYVASYIVANLQFAKIKAEYYKSDYADKDNKGLIGDIDDWLGYKHVGSDKSYKESIYLGSNHEIRDFIHNSTRSEKFSKDLDLANYYGAEMEGAMRGKHTVYRAVSESIADLINTTDKNQGFDAARNITAEYIDRRIDNLKSFTENFAPTSQKNAKTRQEHFLVNENRKTLFNKDIGQGAMITDMESLRDQVRNYKGTDRRFLQHALVELGFIHNEFSQLDNMQNNSWRSAPFGSTESHLGTLMAVRGVDKFNEMMTDITDDKGIVRFDAERGKSLSMFSGLSFLTSNLGDFDGDNYITLMHKVTEKIQSIDDRQLSISLYKEQLAAPKVLSSTLSNVDYRALQNKLSIEEERLAEDALALKELQINLNKPDQQGKMAKDISAYMGIDSRFFLGANEGGFRSQGTLAVSSMSALLEQGKGLYGGLAGVTSEINSRVENLLNGGPAAGLKFDSDSLTTMINSLNDSKEANRIFTALGMDANKLEHSGIEQEMKESLAETMRESFEHIQKNMDKDLNQYGEATTESFYQALVGKLHATTKASDALGKVMGAGIGIGMGESTYDVLTKTLGKAGSDVLGKTYNTLLGTFVADSPIVSLYHMLEGNRETIAQQMNNTLGPINDPSNPVPLANDSGTKFMANIQAAYDKAQDLQGWNKSIQQMLRDSIKLKGDSTSVMNKLRDLSKDYDRAALENNTEEIRAKLIDDMASKIGPGAGMKGLMNLNKMIHANTKGSYGDAEQDYHLIGDERSTAEGLLSGYKTGGDENALIKYKVSNQLRSITTMFNFEKNYGSIDIVKGELKIDNKATSNRVLEQTIADSLHGFLGKQGGTDKTMLLLAEHATGSRDIALELTNKLYSSVESFNKLSEGNTSRAKGYGVGISEKDRDRAIVDSFNQFAADLIGHNKSGVMGVMLADHANIELDDSNKAKLNQVREGGAGLSTAALLVHSHYQSLVQTKNFMGDYGNGLDRFVHLNHASQEMQRNISKGLNDVGTNLLGSDLFNAAYRLMAQGKMSMEGGSVMNRLFKAVNDPNMSNADAMGKMLSNFSGDEDTSREMATQYKHLQHVQIQHESTLKGVEGKKETVGDLIERNSQKTSQGFKLQAISEIASALRDTGDMSVANYKSIYKAIQAGGDLSDKDADLLAKNLMADQGLLLGSLTQEGKDYFKPTVIHRGSGLNTTTQGIKAGIANASFNVVGPALLSMLGGAIYGTSKDEAGMDVQGVIGGTLSLMGFNMPQGKGAAHVAGALFRSKAYNNPEEEWATNMAKAASTELSLGLVGQYVTPKLTEVFNKNIVAPLTRNNLPIIESGVSAIIGSFVGSVVMNMLDSTIQQSAGLLKDTKFNSGDNNLNNRLAQLQDNLSDVIASRGEAEIDPMSADRFIDITDKLDMPPLVVGVWATDGEIEGLTSDNGYSSNETYLVGGQEANV